MLEQGLVTNLSHSIPIKFVVQTKTKRNGQMVLNGKDNTAVTIKRSGTPSHGFCFNTVLSVQNSFGLFTL